MSESVTLPPGAVWTTAAFINLLFYIIIALVIGIAILGGVFFVTKFREPRESKKTTQSAHQRRDMLFLAGDNNAINVYNAFRVHHEGAVETRTVGKKFRQHYTGFLSRRSPIEKIVDVEPVRNEKDEIDFAATQKKQDITEKLASYINSLMTRGCYLPGAKVRVWFGVEPMALLTSILGIAGLEMTSELKNFFGDAFLVDVKALNMMVVGNSWKESQINAQEADKIEEGKVLAGTQNEDFKKLALYLGVLLIGVGVFLGMFYLVMKG